MAAMRCPTCRQTFAAESSGFRPFCSKRCKLIDLGKWLDGDYAVPGEPASDEDIAAEPKKPERDPRRH